jgi:hypothetical protein
MENKALYSVEDIAADLHIKRDEAAGLLNELNGRIERSGRYVINGLIPKAYYEKQKAEGFLDGQGGEVENSKMAINEKRLISLEEFCEYAGGIGICTARKYIKRIGVEMRIGGRVLVDREKFDRWCDANDAAD